VSKREKVMQEIKRPTFRSLELHKKCAYIPYSELQRLLSSPSLKFMKWGVVDSIAERVQ